MAEPITLDVLAERLNNLSLTVAEINHKIEDQNAQFTRLPYVRQDLYDARHEALRNNLEDFKGYMNRELAAVRLKYTDEIAEMKTSHAQEMAELRAERVEDKKNIQDLRRLVFSSVLGPIIVGVVLFYLLSNNGVG